MKYKSPKRKKPCGKHGSWLCNIGTFLIGIASIAEVAFKIVAWLLAR